MKLFYVWCVAMVMLAGFANGQEIVDPKADVVEHLGKNQQEKQLRGIDQQQNVAPSDQVDPQQSARTIRMGSGDLTFDLQVGWGLRPNGTSAVGPTHGGVVIDKSGNIYFSCSNGVHVFTPDGVKIHKYSDPPYRQLHDIEIREEDGEEFIYGAANRTGQGVKFRVPDGKVMLTLPFPKESGLDLPRLKPTAITVAANGDIFLSDGYASNHIFKFDKTGKYLMHFGEKGNGVRQFSTAHGMTVDSRYDPPRLLICDRNHKPNGRLVHYDLDGNFIQEVNTTMGLPCSLSIQGDYVSVPDLRGRLSILNKDNVIVAVLGYNSDVKRGNQFKTPQSQWVDGVFNGTHGSTWDRQGNLYVQDWNIDGRIRKLVRVK
jgi:hypothetical protein